MACLLEALGMAPLGSATPTAPSSARLRVAEQVGRLITRIAVPSSSSSSPSSDPVPGPLRPQSILTRHSFENAITVLHALGGSTNAIVHLLALAGRVPALGPSQPRGITLDDIDRIGRKTPLLVDLKPSGVGYMEDFHRAGGVPSLLARLAEGGLLHLDALTITGRTLGAELASFPAAALTFPQTVIRPLADPLYAHSALVVLRGNLAPHGAVLKASAASPALFTHAGRAVVFTSTADLAARIDTPALAATITPDSVLVLQNAGPAGHPGMPEAGLIPIPRSLAAAGVRDMLRVSDARMSGTAQGTVVLHVAPEAARGGALALVRDGDTVGIDVEARRIWVEARGGEEEWKRRVEEAREGEEGKKGTRKRGYAGLYESTVLQADQGADFDWLQADYQGS